MSKKQKPEEPVVLDPELEIEPEGNTLPAPIEKAEGVRAIAQLTEEEFVQSVKDAKLAVHRINTLVHELMEEDVDYGKVPGVSKPILYQEGATGLCRFFKFVPSYKREIHYGDGKESPHVSVVSTCYLHDGSAAGPIIGEAGGACSSWEKKYRYRQAEITCPDCGKTTVIKGKAEYGGGYVCWAKKGGCGAKFADEDKRITDQPRGETENPDPLEQFETIVQMADKRALVMAVRRTTGAGRLFTQDEEILAGRADGPPSRGGSGSPEAKSPEADAQQAPTTPPPDRTSRTKEKVAKVYKVLPKEYELLIAMLGAQDPDGINLFPKEERDKVSAWAKTLDANAKGVHTFRRGVVKLMGLYDSRSNHAPLPVDISDCQELSSMAVDELNWT